MYLDDLYDYIIRIVHTVYPKAEIIFLDEQKYKNTLTIKVSYRYRYKKIINAYDIEHESIKKYKKAVAEEISKRIVFDVLEGMMEIEGKISKL
jgi:hypothetical protein